MYRDRQTESQVTHVLLHHWWAAVDTALGIAHRETYTRRQLLQLLRGSDMRGWEAFDISCLDANPRDSETVGQLETAIDQYIGKLVISTSRDVLQARGESLRRRVQETGFHPATILLAVAIK
ncbi:MAG: hypothetical protein FJZ96_11655 [Chloroflexi bacterium]|nr:hypothetical protein [Chloroflexota bacterium]